MSCVGLSIFVSRVSRTADGLHGKMCLHGKMPRTVLCGTRVVSAKWWSYLSKCSYLCRPMARNDLIHYCNCRTYRARLKGLGATSHWCIKCFGILWREFNGKFRASVGSEDVTYHFLGRKCYNIFNFTYIRIRGRGRISDSGYNDMASAGPTVHWSFLFDNVPKVRKIKKR